MSTWRRLHEVLFKPIDVASLALFRIAFGAILVWEVCRYFDHGWIERYWIEPNFHFTYYGFGWIRPWPAAGMYAHFLALGGLVVCLTLGLCYRVAAVLFWAGFTYVFLLDQTNHLNHFYFVCLLSFLLVFVPAHRAYSIDAWLRPRWASATVPAWTLWLLRSQIGIVYFFGGVAKLNPDWLHGEPMRMWLAERTDFPLLGAWFTQEWMVYLFSYGGLLFDLLIVPLLLWRRTRLAAFALAALFHLCNARLFQIGIFPWLMLVATTLYFPPSWPRRLLASISYRKRAIVRKYAMTRVLSINASAGHQCVVTSLVGLYLLTQLLIPLRHFLYPGNVSWTEEGHRFAWHMKLRSKSSDARFFAVDLQAGATREIDPRLYLTPNQISAMSGRPDMLLQFAHYVAREMELQGHENIQVRAEVFCSLNGRPWQLLLDPTIDLAVQQRTLWPAVWIVPLAAKESGPAFASLPQDAELLPQD